MFLNVCLLYNSTQGTGSSLFSFIKPLFLGKIVYSPSTPAYHTLIKRINETFEGGEAFTIALKQASDVVTSVRGQLQKNEQLAQSVLTAMQQIIRQLAPGSGAFSLPDTKTLDGQLTFLAEALLFAHNTLYCIEWNKFVGRLAGFYTWRSVK